MPPDRTASASVEPPAPAGAGERPLSTSCTNCRSRKVKCDSGRPCNNCTAQGTTDSCTYRPRQKPGLKAGISNELLDRFSNLEAEVQQLREHGISGVNPGFLSRFDSLEQAVAQIGDHPSGRPDLGESVLSRVSGLEHIITMLSSRLADLETRPSTLSASASGSTPSSASTATSFRPPTFGYPHDSARSPRLPQPPPPPPPDLDLPPPDLLHNLIEAYFSDVAPYAPILQRQDLQPTQLPDGLLQWPITIYGVIVSTLRFSFDAQWSRLPPKDQYRDRARNRVILYSCTTTSLASLQALALVALDDIVCKASPRGWGALAMLTRSASHMLLFEEEANSHHAGASVSPLQILGAPSSFAEEESRRRLFWAIYLLDRFSASATGWDFAFPDQHITRKLPAPVEAWDPAMEPTTAPVFRSPCAHPSAFASPTYDASSIDVGYTALVEVFDLLGNVHQLHRSKLEDVQQFVHETEGLEMRLQRWYRSLPHEVMAAQTDSPFILVRALYWATMIKLLSLIAYPLFRNLTPDPQAADNAHSASLAIAALTKIIPIRSPYFAWACFVAARMLVLRAHRRHEPVDPAIHELGQAFRGASASCNLARRYLHLISRALQRLNSLDGTLGGAAALVDLHHTSFSAESALLPSGAVTPVAAGGQYNLGAELGRLPGEGAATWVVGGGGAAAGAGAGDVQQGSGVATGEAAASGDAEMHMWLDSNLLGHGFEGWFDLPILTSPASTGVASGP
ncbi:uncharacterized protein RHOBADRAFT_54296 [Rhodotorula graminis WP1]|uniref:Zn(2)-C6 fungal-type domain-containing protein n=1 Tax=Rhodotorula graminis (strain WP1) TaxID=578459 RepID=A0A194S187_RHOGW|nr:uncharacterized protein RHOBADRAFT_54296 [Rhodotorula graminis WP1]KPV74483.1 hypothetical protein RHOBADRAFT_54296 [Rhodotorula graminis WP1]